MLSHDPVRWQRLGERLIGLALQALLLALSLASVLPLLLVISASLSSEAALARYGYTLLPRELSLVGYQYIFQNVQQILRSYGVTLLVTVGGTLLSLLVTALLAYTLSRRDFALRRPLAAYLFFTLLFSGGLVPSYILITQYLQLRNNLLVLILPYLVGPFNVLILRTYFAALPEDLLDAARVDGAGEWRIFFQIVLPLSTPALATISLFIALAYWNDWWLALLYITDQRLMPIQLLLYNLLTNFTVISDNPLAEQLVKPPLLPIRMGMVVLTVLPVALLFIFVQRHFVRGLTIGSLRG
jgi:putative aldouronate transport system permease protein